jgi:regulator of protease activity HflC (stomatin/prohibitin superfamily)
MHKRFLKNYLNQKYLSKNFSSQFIQQNRVNTLINICKQNEDIVIERLGRFHRLQKSGIFFAFPIIDKIRYVFDNRELTIPIDPQHATTQDNVTISIAGVVYIKFIDAYKTAYGVSDPIYSVSQFAQSAMRAVVGKHALDDIFHSRNL